METKICKKCLEYKPIESFYPTKHGGRVNECSSCKTEYHRAYREKHRGYLKLRRIDKTKAKMVKELKVEAFKPRKCAKRDCSDPAVPYEGLIKFCKSHALDYIFSVKDV